MQPSSKNASECQFELYLHLIVFIVVWKIFTLGQTQTGLELKVYLFITQNASLPSSDAGNGIEQTSLLGLDLQFVQ